MSALQPAPNGYPIKLVRDRTPAIINASGEPGALFYDTEDLPPAERWPWLRRKLIEECAEYVESHAVAELADVLAVIEGLAVVHGMTLDELAALAAQDERGGFLHGRMMRGHHAEFDGEVAA
jgi:predicted house-cleaning noncanonical NTP pyrophosphatase (MazG superfamily)